jgi:hypothetical protein
MEPGYLIPRVGKDVQDKILYVMMSYDVPQKHCICTFYEKINEQVRFHNNLPALGERWTI